MTEIESQAREILNFLVQLPFPDCIPISRDFAAQEIDYPVEAVLEMAIAGFLDREALSFVDCQPRY
jgi:hypothetical protein